MNLTETDQHQQISPFAIGIIVVSIVAGIVLIGVSFLLVRRINNIKNIFNIFSNKKSNIPVTSSLDNQEVFSTILEYPPPVTIASTANSSKRLLLEQSLAEQQNKIDPISMSLARQSLDGRICYKNSPSKTPVPYCNNSSLFLGHFDKNNSSTIVIEEEEDSDEDRKMMQRLSASSYQVW